MNRAFAEPLDDKIDWRVFAVLVTLLLIVVYGLDFFMQQKEDVPKQSYLSVSATLERKDVCTQTTLIGDISKVNQLRLNGLIAESKRLPLVVTFWTRFREIKPWGLTEKLKLPQCLKRLPLGSGQPA